MKSLFVFLSVSVIASILLVWVSPVLAGLPVRQVVPYNPGHPAPPGCGSNPAEPCVCITVRIGTVPHSYCTWTTPPVPKSP